MKFHWECPCVFAFAHFKWTLLSAVKLKNDKNRTPPGIWFGRVLFGFIFNFFLGLPTERVRDLDLALRALAKSPPPGAVLTFDSRSLHIDFSSSILCVFTFQAQNRETFVLRNYPSGSWVLFFFSAFFKHCFFFLHFCSSVQFSAKLKSMTFWARGLVGRETKYAVRKVQQNMARLVRLNR